MGSHTARTEPTPAKRTHERAAVDASTADPQTAITERDTARLIGLATITLTQKRARGEGPPFFRVGRHVRYILADVLAWRAARVVGKRP